MLEITIVFWMFVGVFAFMGFVRGWAREVLVTSSVVLAFTIIFVLESYVPFIASFFQNYQIPGSEFIPKQQFWFRTIILLLLIFFGYETPSIPKVPGNRFKRDNFRDSALGFFLGAFNGYLVLGSLWAFMGQAGYPFDFIIQQFSDSALNLYGRLPPFWLLESPLIFIAVILAFLFVIVVFV